MRVRDLFSILGCAGASTLVLLIVVFNLPAVKSWRAARSYNAMAIYRDFVLEITGVSRSGVRSFSMLSTPRGNTGPLAPIYVRLPDTPAYLLAEFPEERFKELTQRPLPENWEKLEWD